MEAIADVGIWHWLILGVCLFVLEVLAPGVVFLWIGLAAMATGVIFLAMPDVGWEIQVLVFAVLSVVCAVGGRQWIKSRPIETDQPTLNRRGEQYVGRKLVLVEPIVNGSGKVRVDDTLWKASGPDLAKGETVKVTGVEGTVLVVVKAE